MTRPTCSRTHPRYSYLPNIQYDSTVRVTKTWHDGSGCCSLLKFSEFHRMSYEVELKFRLQEVGPVESKVRQIGAIERLTDTHVDRYYNHPSRNFRSTDEA